VPIELRDQLAERARVVLGDDEDLLAALDSACIHLALAGAERWQSAVSM